MDKMRTMLNKFFVDCFNNILREEERVMAELAGDKISVKEVHLIEAVYKAKEQGDNTLGNVANILGVSQGTLSVAISALEKKGYVERVQSQDDRRSFSLACTERGEFVNEEHKKFHEKMIDDIVENMEEKQLVTLTEVLGKLSNFFKRRGELKTGCKNLVRRIFGNKSLKSKKAKKQLQ